MLFCYAIEDIALRIVTMKKILLMGPPGSGKGTQATALTERFGWPVISAGDLLRAEIKKNSPLGKEIAALINKGHLVADRTIIKVIEQQLASLENTDVVLIDGFPRTIGQAEALDSAGLGVQAVINLAIDPEVLVERLSGRRITPSSGRTYHLTYNPPKNPGVDDTTGEALVQRPDDQPEHIRTRMTTYHQSTAPVISYYEQQSQTTDLAVLTVDASLPITQVFDEICGFITPLTQGE